MIELPNVTLFCISSNKVKEAIKVLQYSMRGIKFGAVKLITHEDPGNLPEGIEFSKCYEIKSIHDYNYYCLYNLTNHIDTDYCLLIQPDGFVINPEKWDDDWFNYDYIGAPWALAKDAYLDPWNKPHRVGNGGFSFRSKKLLDVPKHAYIHFDVNWGDFYKHMNVGLPRRMAISAFIIVISMKHLDVRLHQLRLQQDSHTNAHSQKLKALNHLDFISFFQREHNYDRTQSPR